MAKATRELLTAPLGQLPLGLLDFFAVKSMGEYPQRLGDSVLPVMDLTRWYADQVAATGVASIANMGSAGASVGQMGTVEWLAGGGSTDFANGVVGTTVVPQNEMWLVLEATTNWFVTDPAGSAFSVLTARASPNNDTFLTITDGPLQGFTTGAAGGARGGGVTQTRPVILTPGMELVTRNYGQDAGAGIINVLHSVRIRRLLR